jgi:DNA-binding CsgD family transcriptional regulator
LNKPNVTEKEFEIINIIGDGVRSNQREISSKLGFSLGMTNFLLRRLATKGYLRIQQLNRKKVEYLLTPRGISEKAAKSYNYMLKTLESFRLIKEEIRTLLNGRLNPEIKELLVSGNGDLADLVELALRDYQLQGYKLSRFAHAPKETGEDVLILNTSAEPLAGKNGNRQCIDVLIGLAKDHQVSYVLSSTKKPS